jgi:hypothetical protein
LSTTLLSTAYGMEDSYVSEAEVSGSQVESDCSDESHLEGNILSLRKTGKKHKFSQSCDVIPDPSPHPLTKGHASSSLGSLTRGPKQKLLRRLTRHLIPSGSTTPVTSASTPALPLEMVFEAIKTGNVEHFRIGLAEVGDAPIYDEQGNSLILAMLHEFLPSLPLPPHKAEILTIFLSRLRSPLDLEHKNKQDQSVVSILQQSEDEQLHRFLVSLQAFNQLIELEGDLPGQAPLVVDHLQKK